MKKKFYLVILSMLMAIILLCNSTNIIAQEHNHQEIGNEEINPILDAGTIEVGTEDIMIEMRDVALYQDYLAKRMMI